MISCYLLHVIVISLHEAHLVMGLGLSFHASYRISTPRLLSGTTSFIPIYYIILNSGLISAERPGFNQFDDEAKVGQWTGILGEIPHRLGLYMPNTFSVSTFFLTQFLTSLLWVRRVVLPCRIIV